MDDRADLARNAARQRSRPDPEASDPMRIVLAIIGVLGAAAVLALNVSE